MKILVSDFDGTFYNDDYEKNIQVVNDFVAKGNIFVIATGRNITQLRAETDSYKIDFSYLICNDGAVIYDNNYNPLYREDIDANIVPDIFDNLSSKKYIGEVFIDTGSEYLVDTSVPANGILAKTLDYDKGIELLKELGQKYKTVHGYINNSWMYITDIKATKARGIMALVILKAFNIKDIYTIGDDINDISMNSLYKGYAITDGLDELKEKSKGETNSFSDFVDFLNENKSN